MRQAQGKNPFGARPDGHPLVGICTGLRHARFDLHERSAYAGSTAAHLTVADALRHRRIPCPEEISTETEDVPCVGEIKRWQLLASEAQRVRTAQHFVTEQIVRNRRRGAESRQKLTYQNVAMTRAAARQTRERLLIPGRLERIQPRHNLADCVVPGDRVVSTVATRTGTLQRLRDSVRVVGNLDAGLAARTQAASIDQVLRRALEFLRRGHPDDARLTVAEHIGLCIHDANGEPASRPAERTDARLPYGDTGDDVLAGQESNDLVFGVAATGERRARAGDRRELDERATIH